MLNDVNRLLLIKIFDFCLVKNKHFLSLSSYLTFKSYFIAFNKLLSYGLWILEIIKLNFLPL